MPIQADLSGDCGGCLRRRKAQSLWAARDAAALAARANLKQHFAGAHPSTSQLLMLQERRWLAELSPTAALMRLKS